MSTVKADVEVLKEQVATIKEAFDEHVTQNREDFKEVHSRMSTMKREISEEINLTFEKLYDKIDENEKDIGGLEKWKWTLGGVMLAMTFLMTLFSTFHHLN
tara:strand:+ start:2324 stop:2626 length:303 start_codon:yes stop_codon:yes gene_type:complete